MALENKIKCKNGCEDSLVEVIKERDFFNFVVGMRTSRSLKASNPAHMGFLWYCFDIPLGPKKHYKCRKCGYEWKK